MPFKKTEKGVVWENPGRIDPKDFLLRLKEDKKTPAVPESIQTHLSHLIQSAINSSDRLQESNVQVRQSISSIVQKGIQPVDIIIPVFNGVHVLRTCLDSIVQRTKWPHKITIVDDASSDPYTKKYLDQIPNTLATVLTQKKNKGFAASVNKGIRNTTNPYVCILNSDVIVTEGWLTKQILALESDERNMITNPCTNNTALINVPMQENFSYLEMNAALEQLSSRRYPEIMPTGFCFTLKRKLIDAIGPFDEGFAHGYGEETSFWMATISRVNDGEYSKWRAVLTDDAYLFHERGSSFSSLGNEKHLSLRQIGSSRFHTIWPGFKQWQKSFDVEEIMNPLRKKIPLGYKNQDSPYNISFVVHSTGISGGMAVITDIVNEFVERGINVNLSLIKRKRDSKAPSIGNLRVAPTIFNSYADFVKNFKDRVFSKGIIVASTAELVPPVWELEGDYKKVLFAQSYDLELVENLEEETKEVLKKIYKEVPYIITGSSWIDKKIQSTYKRNTLGFVRPGINQDLFHFGDRNRGDDRPTVLFSINNSYPFKGANRGIKVAKALVDICKRNNKEIRILAYGPISVASCPEIIGLGTVSQTYLSKLLTTEVDIFCDPSLIHSYGLPGLEALACGVTPAVWDNKGIHEYASEKEAIILPQNAPSGAMASKIYDELFIPTKTELKSIQRRSGCVEDFIDKIETEFKLKQRRKTVNIITPHLRKHGGPTTILKTAELLQKSGHDVWLYTIYPDINLEVIRDTKVPIHVDWQNLRPSDVLITNSDNEHNKNFSSTSKAKKKIMLKLSHNARFQKLEDTSLTYKWDNIITSSSWLKEACEKPLVDQGWTHPPAKATRVGWYHYSHEIFSAPPNMRTYGSLDSTMKIGFLAHHHKLKGTNEALFALKKIKEKFQDKVEIIAIGEWPQFAKIKPPWVQYALSPSRKKLAEIMRNLDIWLTSSHTEGLGRMTLEAMSSSCAIVMTDTGAEFANPGHNCLIAGRGNSGQMAKHVNTLIEDPELFSRLVKNSYETACKYADSKEYLDRLNEVICE